MKKLIFTLPLIALIGCASNPKLTAEFVRLGSSDAVLVGLSIDPTIRPYLVASKEVICASAASTNVNPAAVVSALEKATNVTALASPTGKLVINNVIGIYNLAYGALGSTNSEALQPYLSGACQGMTEALGDGAGKTSRRTMPPHVH